VRFTCLYGRIIILTMKKAVLLLVVLFFTPLLFAQTDTIAAASYDRGVEFYNSGETDSAIMKFTEAIRLDPNYALAYNNRGYVYYLRQDYDRAIEDYEIALRIDPDQANVRRFIELARQAQ